MGPPEVRPIENLAAIFQNGVQYALVTWETSTSKAMQGSYWPCIALLSNIKLPQHVTNSMWVFVIVQTFKSMLT